MKKNNIVLGSQQMNLYYPRPRKKYYGIGTIKIARLHEKLQGMNLMTQQDMCDLIKNQHLIPEEWKKAANSPSPNRVNRIFFLDNMPKGGYEHHTSKHVFYICWRRLCLKPHWVFSSTPCSEDLFSCSDYEDCVAVHGSIFSNYVSRVLCRISPV